MLCDVLPISLISYLFISVSSFWFPDLRKDDSELPINDLSTAYVNLSKLCYIHSVLFRTFKHMKFNEVTGKTVNISTTTLSK
jgi:hypothetical protein